MTNDQLHLYECNKGRSDAGGTAEAVVAAGGILYVNYKQLMLVQKLRIFISTKDI